MTAPHQDERVEDAILAASDFGVEQLATLAAGHLPVTETLRGIALDLVEAGIRHFASLVHVSPRVDVTAGPAATVTVVIHGDPGASPDTRPE